MEIALDLKELNSITRQRQAVRDSLEKAIAYYEATNIRPEVFIQTGKVRRLARTFKLMVVRWHAINYNIKVDVSPIES